MSPVRYMVAEVAATSIMKILRNKRQGGEEGHSEGAGHHRDAVLVVFEMLEKLWRTTGEQGGEKQCKVVKFCSKQGALQHAGAGDKKMVLMETYLKDFSKDKCRC